jgi:hypothetical protein
LFFFITTSLRGNESQAQSRQKVRGIQGGINLKGAALTIAQRRPLSSARIQSSQTHSCSDQLDEFPNLIE